MTKTLTLATRDRGNGAEVRRAAAGGHAMTMLTLITQAKLDHDRALGDYEAAMVKVAECAELMQGLSYAMDTAAALLTEGIAAARSEDGKSLYSNEAARTAALTLACDMDDAWLAALVRKREYEATRAKLLASAEAALSRAKGERAFLAAIAALGGHHDG